MLLMCILGFASDGGGTQQQQQQQQEQEQQQQANILGEPLDVPAHGLVEDAKEVAEKVLTELEIETHLDGFPALVLLIGAGTALGLVVYYFITLSDLSEDLINPYTLCDRINPKLRVEFAAHAFGVAAFVIAMQPQLVVASLPALALRALWWKQRKLVIDATTCYNSTVQSGLRTRWGILCVVHVVGTLFGFIQCAANSTTRRLIHTFASSPPAHPLRSLLARSLAVRPLIRSPARLPLLLLLLLPRVLLHGILGLHKAMPNTMDQMGRAHMMHAEMLRGLHGEGHGRMAAMGMAGMHGGMFAGF